MANLTTESFIELKDLLIFLNIGELYKQEKEKELNITSKNYKEY